jgi:hypothetical protein
VEPSEEEEFNSIIEEAKKAQGIEHEVKGVDESKVESADNPFSPDSGAFTIDRDSGSIIYSKQRLKSMVEGMRADGMSEDQIGKTIQATLFEERDHLSRTPGEGEAYLNTLSSSERALGRRIYGGRTNPKGVGLSDSNLGLEHMRRRAQQLAGMTPTEIVQQVGREKWTLASLDLMERSIRRSRELMGTKAAGMGDAIFNRKLANIAVARAALNAQQPGSPQRDETTRKNVEDLRASARQYRESGDEASADELEQMAKDLEQKGSEESFAFSPRRSSKTDKNQSTFDALMNGAKFSQMRLAAAGDRHAITQAEKQKFKDAVASVAQQSPGSPMRSSNSPNADAERLAFKVGGLKYIGNWQVRDKGYWMFNITQPGRETTMVAPEGVSEAALLKQKNDKIAEYDAAEKQAPGSPVRGRGRPEKRNESIKQELMGFTAPSVNSAIEAQKAVPEGERKGAAESGALPPLSAADLENRADQWMKDNVAATMEKVEKAPTAGGSVALPKFKDFVEGMKKKQGGIQPGQMKEMWQRTVDSMLNAATDDQLRAMTQAGFGRDSRLARFARAALSYTTGDKQGQQDLGLTVGKGAKVTPGAEPKFRERYPNPKTVATDPSTGLAVKRSERDLNAEAATRQEAKDQRSAPRRREMIVSALFKRMVLPAYREDALPIDRKTITPSEIRNGGGKSISAYQNFDATAQDDPELGAMLVDDSRRSGEDPVTVTKRLTVILDKQSGKVSIVSTYKHPTKGTMLVDPAHPQGHHAPLDDILRRYRVIQSILLDQPVKGFKRNFASLKDYNENFGNEARENFTRETSYDPNSIPISEFVEGTEGSEGVEGEGGDIMGPGKSAAMAVTGVGGGAVEKSSYTPMTDVERSAIIDHLYNELGSDPQSMEDARAILDDLTEGGHPAAVMSGMQKIAQMIQQANPDLDTESLVNLMAKTLYEDKNLEATVARSAEAAAAKAGEGARTEVPAKPSDTAKELTMGGLSRLKQTPYEEATKGTAPQIPMDRRPPTDVRPENEPPGTEQHKFLRRPPVPEATTTPRDPEYLSPEDAQWVNELALMPEFHAEAAGEALRAKDYKPTQFTPSPEAPEPKGVGERTLTDRPPQKQLKEQSPMSPARERIRDEMDKKRRQVNATWMRRATKQTIKATADGVDNQAIMEGERARQSLKLTNKDEMVRATPMALLACGKVGENPKTGRKFFFYDPKMLESKITQAQLGSMKAEDILRDLKSDRQLRKYAAKWKEAADRLQLIAQYTKDHWDDPEVRSMAQACRRELYDQLSREHENGVSTTDFGESYFPSRYEGEIFNLDTITFGEDRIVGNRFTSRKRFRDHYEAIRNGPFIPKSYDAADIISHRVRQGMKSVARSTWTEALKDMKDQSSGKPVAMSAVPTHPRSLVDPDSGDKVFHHDSWEAPSPEYELVYPTPSSQPIAMLKPYADLTRTVLSRSAFQGNPLGEGALYFTSMLKHGVVLIGDTFHPARLLQYATAMRGGEPSWRNGFAALTYRAEDLDAAVKSGDVHPAAAAWAKEKMAVNKDGTHALMTKQAVLEDMIKNGLNATKIGDAIYRDSVQKIPLVGEFIYGHGVGWYNRLIFDRLIPGLIADGAVRSFDKLHKANPDVPYDKLMRDVITDMNTFYGNMGRQGIFTNPTLRDFAQVFMLAPMWQEGLIGKEARTMGRLTGISNLTGRRGVPQMGALGSAMIKGLASYFVLTQAINLATRRQLTFQNKEKGHDLDAWLPTGRDTGLWISPLSVFAEKTHDLIRLSETKPKAWDAIVQMGENTLGPVGKFEAVLRTSRKPTGEYITTTPGLLGAAAEQLAPVPISFGKPLAWAAYAAGMGPKPEPGTTARQIMASGMGIKTQPGQDISTQVETSARKFAQDNHLKTDTQVILPTDEPSYSKMRHFFKIGDTASAKKLFDALMEKRKPWENVSDRRQQILNDMQNWARRPLTGSQKGDMLWKHSMTDDERALYTEAVHERMELLYGWEKWYLTNIGNPVP